MQTQAQITAHSGNSLNFSQRINLPGFGRLGDGDGAGLGEVNIRAACRQRADGIRRQLAALGGGGQQFGAV